MDKTRFGYAQSRIQSAIATINTAFPPRLRDRLAATSFDFQDASIEGIPMRLQDQFKLIRNSVVGDSDGNRPLDNLSDQELETLKREIEELGSAMEDERRGMRRDEQV